MKLSATTGLLLLLSPLISSLSIPELDLAVPEQDVTVDAPEVADLEKRRGGGGGRGGGSSGSGSGSSGGSSSGSSSGSGSKGGGGSSSGSSSGSSGTRGSTSSSSNSGGSTRSGSGTARSYGGGSYYPGGATTPYTAGTKSPSGITPYLLTGAALGFGAAAWHYAVWTYPYGTPYYYHHPIVASGQNGNDSTGNYTIQVVCLCEKYQVCGCDGNTNSTYLNEIIGDPPHNSSAVTIMKNGTNETAYINGTLANGTTAADPSISGASGMAMQWNGYWPAVMLVSAMVWAL